MKNIHNISRGTIQQMIILLLLTMMFSCKRSTQEDNSRIEELKARIEARTKKIRLDSIRLEKKKKRLDSIRKRKEALKFDDDEFVNIEKLSSDFILDVKYATTDNFLKSKVYDCQRCFVRGAVVKSLLAAQQELLQKGYKFKLFDCFRPHSVQKKMWEIYPRPGYVADPKGGSVHNRGAALDLTLTDLQGKELDMGTGYDHFGREAAHSYTDLSEEVKANRKLLRATMERHGFQTIRTEWWHYNYAGGRKFPISDFTWKCN